ncbi:MAG: hypothetical protein F6K42_12970 [Leptolyngbya sp. SIO1D8]|nr:hypothetical protein [Leptolyngbya sp. SIO1D8]
MSKRLLKQWECLDTLRKLQQEDEDGEVIEWFDPSVTSISELGHEIRNAINELECAQENLDVLKAIQQVRMWYSVWTAEDLAYINGDINENPRKQSYES